MELFKGEKFQKIDIPKRKEKTVKNCNQTFFLKKKQLSLLLHLTESNM